MPIIFETQDQKLFYHAALGETEIKIKNIALIFNKYVEPMDKSIVVPAGEVQSFLDQRTKIAAKKAEEAAKKQVKKKE